MNDTRVAQAVPGPVPEADLPDFGFHVTTFGAMLASGFLLSMLLPVVPLAVLLVAAWGMVAGLVRIARPGWRRLPFTRLRLAYSRMDGLIWMVSMGAVARFAVVVMEARP